MPKKPSDLSLRIAWQPPPHLIDHHGDRTRRLEQEGAKAWKPIEAQDFVHSRRACSLQACSRCGVWAPCPHVATFLKTQVSNLGPSVPGSGSAHSYYFHNGYRCMRSRAMRSNSRGYSAKFRGAARSKKVILNAPTTF